MRQHSPCEPWADHPRSLYGQWFGAGKTVKANKKINTIKISTNLLREKLKKWDKGLARIVSVIGQLGWCSKGTARDAETDFLKWILIPLHYIRRYLCTECSVHFHSSSASPLRVGFWDLIYADPCLYQALSIGDAPFAHPWKPMDTGDYSLWAGGDSNGFHL